MLSRIGTTYPASYAYTFVISSSEPRELDASRRAVNHDNIPYLRDPAMTTQTSKFFRIATEGATTDGREIQRDWLEQMANNYDPQKFCARIWVEHLRSLSPKGDFGAYGDVVALEAREVEDGKLALFAQISPLPELVKLNREKQKLYTSMEVNTNFADTGEAYLVGLAVTDSPASLGTEVLQFSANNPDASPFANRKQAPGNLFSEAVEADIELEAQSVSLSDRVRRLFTKGRQNSSPDSAAPFMAAMEVVADQFASLKAEVESIRSESTKVEALSQKIKTLEDNLTTLRSQLSTEDSDPASRRPPASGGNGAVLTDC